MEQPGNTKTKRKKYIRYSFYAGMVLAILLIIVLMQSLDAAGDAYQHKKEKAAHGGH